MKIRFFKRNTTYGGVYFVDYDTKKNNFVYGNTASTAQPLTWYDMDVEVKTNKELERIKDYLKLNGAKDLGRK